MRSRSILLFFSVVIGVLTMVSFLFPSQGVSVGSLYLRFPTLHSLTERTANEMRNEDKSQEPGQGTIVDSVRYYRDLVNSGNLRFWLPEPHYFDAMWQRMEQAGRQNRTVRVLHYGDSQIEMDHISSRLRANLQDMFGGGGPGMLPFQTITPSLTVRQSSQGSLLHLASFGDSLTVRSRGNYGIMMQCFRLEGGDATVTVKAANSNRVDDRAKAFSKVTLIANNRGGLNYEITNLKGKKSSYRGRMDTPGVHAVRWQADTLTNGIRVHVNGSADLYALLVDADSGGVAVDNIPMRGCSGQQFKQVKEDLLTAAYATMDIGLIIMQFGGNSVPYFNNSEQIATYCRSIGEQIDYVHKCCPKAKILFVGPSDMSRRVKGELQTYPIIPELIDSLIATVNAHNAAFWSIYHAMGGWNTMPEWSRKGLAGSDYIHFSQSGADLLGDRMSQAFANSYNLYRLERKLGKVKPGIQSQNSSSFKRGRIKKGGRQ